MLYDGKDLTVHAAIAQEVVAFGTVAAHALVGAYPDAALTVLTE